MKTVHFFKELMKIPVFVYVVFSVIFFSSTMTYSQHELQEIFLNPPDDARPRGYWLWAHGNFDYATIKEELKEFKKMGLGGVDIYDMGIADPYDIIPSGNQFMSDQMIDGIEFALNKAEELGLSMGLSVSNGWNAGGDWTKPDEMIMRLLFWKDTLQGPVELSRIGFPEIPTTFEKPYGTYKLYPQFDENGFPTYYENVALVAYPLTADNKVNSTDDIVYFDASSINGNDISISLPAGDWVLVRAVVTPLGQRMWMISDKSNGFIMDHYSKKATKNHFEYVIKRLEDRLGDLSRTSLERLYLASFEAEDYVIWSPELKETFAAQHGYDMDPYIPILAGLKVVDEETTKRFLYDYRLTVSEMFLNNHYRQARDICHEHGLLLASESGGPGPPLHYVPTEDLKALGSVDVMRGEFWNRKPQHFDKYGNDLTYVVKNIASAAHIYGHKIVEMEAFTSHNKHWQERPVELKKLADEAYCTGMTRVVYHTMPHSPKEAGVPGWSYQAGTHISPKMTWWKFSRPFHDYFARTSALLQQGDFVADVAYYYGEEIPNFAIGVKYIRNSLGKGYDYDDLNKEVLLKSSVTDEGQILLPSGMKYHLLVLPENADMSLEVLSKIETLLKNGASVLGNRPLSVPGLKNYQNREQQLNVLADKIWRKSRNKYKRNYGKGIIYCGYTEREILEDKGISPDFQYKPAVDNIANLDYIHRRTSNDDIYFISNKDSTSIQAIADFRISGRQPYRYDPEGGSISKLVLYYEKDGRTLVPVDLDAYGSIFIVFPGEGWKSPNIISIEKDGQPVFPQNIKLDFNIRYNDKDEIVFTSWVKGSYRFTFNDGSVKEINCKSDEEFLMLTNKWDVYFPNVWGFEPVQQFDHLLDWTLHADKELSIFSGTATYKGTFMIDGDSFNAEKCWMLDLGQVGEVASVYLNGHELGTSVFPPYDFNISSLLKAGENYLVIEVANTWLNQLIGEKDKPFDEQRTRSNLGRGGRDEGRRPWSNYALQPSGLIGPVRILQREKIIFKF
jgi:hypothetical protein